MSEDPINPGSSPVHQDPQLAQINPDIYIPVSDTSTTYGTFDSIVLFDGAQNQHLLEGQFNVKDNTLVWLYYSKTSGGQITIEHYIMLGSSFNEHDPGYWKMDGFMVSVLGNDLVIRVRGHQPQQVNPSSPYQAQGSGRATYRLAGVWSPTGAGES